MVPESEGALLQLAERLREEPVDVQGVALAYLLTTDGTSPLYDTRGAYSLWHVARGALPALEPVTIADPDAADERRRIAPPLGWPHDRPQRDLLAAMAHRLLIAVGEPVASPDQLPFGIRALVDAADEILVITPALPTRLDWLASATDRAREQADERLQTVLGQLADLGSEAAGAVGADDPLVAFEDAIRQFAPDHLLIALRAGEESGWQERGLLDQLQKRFELPLTAFSVAGS